MANNNQMTFSIGIKTNYDAEGIRRLQSDLSKLQQNASKNMNFFGDTSKMQESLKAAQNLKIALSEAYNPKLGTLTIDRFNQSLKKSGTTLKELQVGMHNFGSAGDIAFSNASIDLLKMNNIAKSSTTLFDKMFNTFKNTITWGLSSALWNNITGSIQKSYYYIKDLDEALNDIRIVTSKSNEEMEKFAINANNAAKALAVSTEDYTQGALIYYQQGLSDEEVKRRTDITAKTSNVTGQSMSAVSEQLTAVWNGYKVSATEAELYVDRLAAVAATTASDLEELSTGMSKVASSAAALGVSEEQLAAMLSTTISVTRQAPESVGTAYKTIFARISDIEAGLDAETSLGNYTEKMAAMGITVLDASGKLRDMGDVIEEIGGKWATMSREQQISLAQTMAGTRQYNNLVALFDNWSSYADTLQVAANAEGTLDKQQAIAMDSIKNRLDVLKSTWEDLYQNLFDSDDIKEAITGLTKLVQLLADFTESVGGLKSILPGILSIILQIGSVRIGAELGNYINTIRSMNGALKESELAFKNFKESMISDTGLSSGDISEAQVERLREVYSRYEQIIDKKKYMNAQDKENLNILLEQEKELTSLKIKAEEYQHIMSAKNVNEVDMKYNIGPKEFNTYGLIKQISDINGTFDFTNAEQSAQHLDKVRNSLLSVSSAIETARDNGESLDTLKITLEDLGKKDASIEPLITVLRNLSDNFNDTVAINKFSKRVEEAREKVNEMTNTMRNAEYQSKATAESWSLFGKGFDLSIMINQLTQVASTVTGIASAISSLNNIWNIWQNDSLTDTQKLLQTLIAVGSAISMLSSPVKKIIDFTKAIVTELGLEEANAIAINNAKTKEIILSEKIALNEKKARLEAEKRALIEKDLAYTKAIENNKETVSAAKATGMLDQNTIDILNKENQSLNGSRRIVRNNLKNVNNELSDTYQGIRERNYDLETLGNTTTKKSAGGLVSLIASNPWIIAALATVAATVGTIYMVEKSRERELKDANKKLENIQEENKKYQEQQEKISNAKTSFAELEKQFQSGKITEQEYRQQTIQLTEELDDQALKAAALAGNYEYLEQKLNSANKSQIEFIRNQYELERNAASNSMDKAWDKGTNFGQDLRKAVGGLKWQELSIPNFIASMQNTFKGIGDESLAIASGNDWNSNEDIYASAQKELGKYFNGTSAQSGFNISNVKTDKDRAAVFEAIEKILEENYKYEGTAYYNQLKELKENMQQGYDAYKSSIEKINELNKQELGTKAIENYSATNKAGFLKEVDELARQAVQDKLFDGEDAYIEARLWAVQMLQGISDETAQWSKTSSLIDLILSNSASGDVRKQVDLEKELVNGNYSNAELEYLAALGPVVEEGMTESLIEGGQKAIDYLEKRDFNINLRALITLGNTNKSFNSEEIQQIMQNGFNNVEFNQEAFDNAGYAEQMQMLITTSVKQQELFAENKDLAKQAAEEYGKTIEKFKEDNNFEELDTAFRTKTYSSLLEEGQSLINEKLFDFNEDGELFDAEGNALAVSEVKGFKDVQQIVSDYIDLQNSGETNEKLEETYNTLVAIGLVDKEAVETVLEKKKSYDELINALQDMNTFQASLISGEVDYAQAIEQTEDVLKYYDSLVEGVQNAYKTLHTAEQEWNEEGSYTVDTIQSLLKMNPAYIECLEVQGDKISVNEEKVNEYTTALLRNEIVMAEQAFLLQMKEALEEGTTSSQWASIMATDAATASTLSLNDSLREEIRLKYEDALANDKLTQSEYDLAMAKLDTMEANYQALYNQAPNVRQNDKKSGSSSSSKDQKNYFKEFDRYWELKKNLEIIGNAIDKLDKKEKNLYGKEKIAALKNKNELIDQQKEAYKALYAEQQKEQAELVGSLQGMGVTFDADGNITNYVAQTSAKLDEYNKAVAAYNSGKMSKKSFDKVEDDYKNFKEYLERYDKLYYSEMKDTADKLAEATRKQMENNLEAWRIEVEIKVDWQKLEREWNNFIADMSKDFTRQFENLDIDLNLSRDNAATYTGEDGTLPVELQQAQDIMDEIDKIMSGEGSDKFESVSQAQEELKKVNSSILSDGAALKKVYEDAYNTFLKKIQQYGEKLEQQMGYYDRIDEQLNHQKELIGLLYGDEAYALMDEYYKGQEKNSLARLESLKTQTDMWEAMYNSAEEGSKEQQEYYEKMVAAQQNLNKETENYIKLLKEDMVNSIKKASKEYENYLTDGKGFDLIKQEWDDLKDYSDNYFDGVEKKYQISAFGNKVDEGINAQDSLAAQKKLQDLKDYELAQLKEKKELTQYDIDAAEQRYNIALKEIALEEAQNAKNSMKVTRDTNGNWTYQYVADDTDVNKKRQELSDEIYKLYEMSKDAYQENIDNMIALQENYLKSVEEIKVELANLDDGDLERKKSLEAELERLNKQYYEQYDTLAKRNSDLKKDAEASYVGVILDTIDKDKSAYEELTENEKTLVDAAKESKIKSYEELEEAVKTGNLNMKDDLETKLGEESKIFDNTAESMAKKWNGDSDSVKGQHKTALDEMGNAVDAYQIKVHEASVKVGEDFGPDGIKGNIDKATESVNTIKAAIDDICSLAIYDLPEVRDKVEEIAEAWRSVSSNIGEAIQQIKEYLKKVGEVDTIKVSTPFPSVGGPGNTYDNGGKGSDGNNEDKTPAYWSVDTKGQVIILNKDKQVIETPEANGMSQDKVAGTYKNLSYYRSKAIGWAPIMADGSINENQIDKLDNESLLDYLNKRTAYNGRFKDSYMFKEFATGGYTGDWTDPAGKLAILHGKELVLNQTDTANILSAVDAIRQISSVGSSISASIAQGIAAMFTGIGSIPSIVSGGDTSNRQNIFNIEASFPNANNVDEIQQAILSLPNLASQYIARTTF